MSTKETMSENWRDNFKTATLKTSFQLTLTRAMLEFISAVADNVMWDRGTHGSTLAFPDNWPATEAALTKRGLISRKPRGSDCNEFSAGGMYSYQFCELTPAGKAVVELLKCTGLFIEADAATYKKAKSKARR